MNLQGQFLRGNIRPMRRVIEEVARVAELQPDEITGPLRHRKYVRARQMAMLICRDYCGVSYPEIARVFRRHHSTVIYSIEAASARCADSDWDDMEAIAKRCDLVGGDHG